MISLAGIAIFVFGNKLSEGKIVEASGVKREFEIAIENGLILIPIRATGFVAEEIFEEVFRNAQEFYKDNVRIIPLVESLNGDKDSSDQIIKGVINIIKEINK